MNPLFFIIVYRPEGSKTWTPLDLHYTENDAGNFFASQERALEFIEERMPERCKIRWIHREEKNAPVEFTVAKVELCPI